MIKIENTVVKTTENFWSHCLFHPTDAIEDSWGKRIIDRFAEDKSIRTIRIYAMLEDIVYTDESGELLYDFRANDLRLQYLIDNGYDLLIAFAAMPDCIAESTTTKTSISFNKTRYKGKMFNTSRPKDYALWEEVCYRYTLHIVEKFGLEQVSKWRLQCFNEPDIPQFFMSSLPGEEIALRAAEYCKLYDAFARAVSRVSDKIKIGGPALALHIEEFLQPWLNHVKENNVKIDFISYHNYGCLGFYSAAKLGVNALSVDRHFEKHQRIVNMLAKCGFSQLPIIIDEWGTVGGGFKNKTQVPELIFRETEVFSAYYTKLISRYIYSDFSIDRLMLCLSGQHEMEEEFTGFRGFFTLNNCAKPIYTAHILASRLYGNVLKCEIDDNIHIIPTTNGNGNYAVMLSYSNDGFEDNLPAKQEVLILPEQVKGKKIKIYCIDKENTNPYRLYQRNGYGENMSEEEIKILRNEGKIKPVKEFTAENTEINLKLTANCVYLITAE